MCDGLGRTCGSLNLPSDIEKICTKARTLCKLGTTLPNPSLVFFFFQIPKSSKKLKIIQTKIVCTLWDEVISELFLVSDEVISGLFVVSNVFVHFART